MSFDAVIIGGGIVGAACAYRLSAEGLKICLVEKNYVASGATAAGMGHLAVMDHSEAQFALTRLSRDLWRGIADELPDQAEYENCGTIWVAQDEAGMAEAEKKQGFYTDRKCKAAAIGNKKLYRLEPNLRSGLAGGLLVEEDSVVYQLCASSFFIKKARAEGAEIMCGETAVAIDSDTLMLESGKTKRAKWFINALGHAAPALSPELNIEGKKGHLVITDRYPGFISHQIVELGYLESAHGCESESVAFNVQPRITGQILIGSSRQPGVSTDDIDAVIVRKMLKRGFEFMPGLREMSALRTWTGIRPSTPDNLPLIGRSASNERVIVAAGHEGLGITTSLGTAELVTDEVFERDSRIPRNPYSPQRFTDRK